MRIKNLRIAILLLILAYVGLDTYLNNKRATDWKNPLRVVIYPINADGNPKTDEYISQLDIDQFSDFQTMLQNEAKRYGLKLANPIRVGLSKQLNSLPPLLPKDRNVFKVMWWSLKLRYWSWKTDNHQGIKPQIKAYALYFTPNKTTRLAHSTGLKESKIALIQLSAHLKANKHNNVVILHELLHTLGATDKYDFMNNQPIFPEGFAQPRLRPTFPQLKAEIMAGRIPLSKTQFKKATGLTQTVVGQKTALEIGWIK